MRGLPICLSCAEKVRRRIDIRGNMRSAMLFGGVTALMSATAWSLVTFATGRPLSSLAVAAGIAIGLAVHRGSRGCGGLHFQIAAMLLVYATFVARYVPPVFAGIADAIKKEHAARIASQDKTQPTPATSGESTPSDIAPSSTTVEGARPAAPAAQPSPLATLKAYFVFTVIAWGVVIASPFMPGTTGTLTLLSLFIGMALAFGLNHRTRLRGPYQG